ncbi:MAG: EFR1 family ferrodoxin [Saccharofermentanales bacterium]|jgi:ferredoxin
MSHYSIHFSPTGGTKKVADILVKSLSDEYQEIDLCQEIESLSLAEQDLCVVSVPTYGGRVPKIVIERLRKISAHGAKAILNCVYGNRAWEDTLTELQDTLEKLGFVCIAAIAAVAEHSIFRQYATGRPDAKDSAELTGFAEKIQNKLKSHEYGPLDLPGSHDIYKDYNVLPFKPEGNENCIACGLCAKNCPVSAIDFDNPRMTDKDQCISCMRCIGICPVHARDLDSDFMKKTGEKMAPILGGYKNNYLFL